MVDIIQNGFQALFGFFQHIIDYFSQLYLVLENLFSNISNGVKIITNLYTYFQRLIFDMPNWLAPFATISIGIFALYFIVGRSHA